MQPADYGCLWSCSTAVLAVSCQVCTAQWSETAAAMHATMKKHSTTLCYRHASGLRQQEEAAQPTATGCCVLEGLLGMQYEVHTALATVAQQNIKHGCRQAAGDTSCGCLQLSTATPQSGAMQLHTGCNTAGML